MLSVRIVILGELTVVPDGVADIVYEIAECRDATRDGAIL